MTTQFVRFAQTFLFLTLAMCAYSQPKYIAKTAMQYDLRYVVKALEHSHVNPYQYQSKAAIKQYIDSVQTSLPDSLPLFAFWQIINKTIVNFNDAHTRTYSRPFYQAFVNDGGKLFPWTVHLSNGQLTVHQTPWQSKPEVTPNTRILSINGVTSTQLIKELRAHASKELTRLDDYQISMDFPRYLWQAYGWGAAFEVKVNVNNRIKTFHLAGVAPKLWKQRKAKVSKTQTETFSYSQLNDSVAYIKIEDFYSHGRKYFKEKARVAFKQINQRKTNQCLIIDIRGHNGGDARYAEDVARYIAPRPFRAIAQTQWKVNKAFKQNFARMYIPKALRWCRPLYVFNRHTRNIWRTKNGQVATVQQPFVRPHKASKRFRGKIYLLTDHFTFSAGSVFAAMFKDFQMGTLVGQATGNLSSFFADPIMWHRLPKSGIRFQVSAAYHIRPNGNQSLEAVRPHIRVAYGKNILEEVLGNLPKNKGL